MSTETWIHDSIERAVDSVGTAWPLHSFVTANPLAGFEDQSFADAVEEGTRLFGGRGYPDAAVFRRAWETGQIDPETLRASLATHGYDSDPETLLARMEARTNENETQKGAAEQRADSVLTKWLAAFFDQGTADWSMPNRGHGFYAAVKAVARYDDDIPVEAGDFSDEPLDALDSRLDDYPVERWPEIFEYHLAALPGWTGFIKYRIAADDDWQQQYPATLVDYLAVRFVLADAFGAPLAPSEETDDDGVSETTNGENGVPLEEVWLDAWETTYRTQLVDAVSAEGRSLDAAAHDSAPDHQRPDAQFVFCIDTRSELIRRHIEAAGNYETHGYAGFFGIPMRFEEYGSDVSVDACPPILDAQHHISTQPNEEHSAEREQYDHWARLKQAGSDVLHTLKSNPGTAFGFVESAGSGYGLALTARTLLPTRVFDTLAAVDGAFPGTEEFCTPAVDHDSDAATELPAGLSLDEQVEYAASAFELMGWQEFGRVVVFAGHASETANNPFESSLDCGACAGNPGGPSARVLATICNKDAVKDALRERGIEIPADTVFVGAEHTTTTDEVTLYDGSVPESHEEDIEQLKGDLETAREGATAERAPGMGADPSDSVRETARRAADWAETRPEWGLAGNASFVIGPRALTADLNLDGRAFLHSYDPSTDPTGEALEAIMAGPMVVTQWINCQYYFSTVDNAVYGSGSKVTHNPVGNVGVYQGNGGDLMTGLPLQSLFAADDEPYHQPLRLSVVIAAPVERVNGVLARNDHLTTLLDNGWLSLTVVDPTQTYKPFHYDGELSWTGASSADAASVEPKPELSSAQSVADD